MCSRYRSAPCRYRTGVVLFRIHTSASSLLVAMSMGPTASTIGEQHARQPGVHSPTGLAPSGQPVPAFEFGEADRVGGDDVDGEEDFPAVPADPQPGTRDIVAGEREQGQRVGATTDPTDRDP